MRRSRSLPSSPGSRARSSASQRRSRHSGRSPPRSQWSSPPRPGGPARRAGGASRLSSVEAQLLAWFGRTGRDLPWRHTHDPYAILVSEVMLQQTQVERVVPRYLAWLERWPTAAALASASPADVIREWQGLGYNRRGLNQIGRAHV